MAVTGKNKATRDGHCRDPAHANDAEAVLLRPMKGTSFHAECVKSTLFFGLLLSEDISRAA